MELVGFMSSVLLFIILDLKGFFLSMSPSLFFYCLFYVGRHSVSFHFYGNVLYSHYSSIVLLGIEFLVDTFSFSTLCYSFGFYPPLFQISQLSFAFFFSSMWCKGQLLNNWLFPVCDEFFSSFFQDFLFFPFSILTIIFLGVDPLVFILLDCWPYFICRLMYFIKLRKFSVIIKKNFFLPFSIFCPLLGFLLHICWKYFKLSHRPLRPCSFFLAFSFIYNN